MTVYTDNPFGGMRNPTPYGGGIAGGLMNRPPPFMPQQPMPQMPRRMPGGPSKGGTTSIPMPRPPMQRPGGPGKGRTRGGLMRRGRGRPMPGGPGKGRGQMQQPMPQPNFGQIGFPARPSFDQLMTQGPINMPRPMPRPAPFMGRVGNNMPQPPMDFPQPTARPVDQTMGRPMPQPNFILGPMNRGGFYSGGITDLY